MPALPALAQDSASLEPAPADPDQTRRDQANSAPASLLEALIPDAAVGDPEGWAAAGVPDQGGGANAVSSAARLDDSAFDDGDEGDDEGDDEADDEDCPPDDSERGQGAAGLALGGNNPAATAKPPMPAPAGPATAALPADPADAADAAPGVGPAMAPVRGPRIDLPWPRIDANAPPAPHPANQWAGPDDPSPIEPDGEPIEFAIFEDQAAPLAPATEVRLSPRLVLAFSGEAEDFPRAAFLARFRGLSAIIAGPAGDDLARLAAQARADEDLLRRLLRVYGYFSGEVIAVPKAGAAAIDAPAVGTANGTGQGPQDGPGHGGAPADAGPRVRFDVVPGPRYRVAAIDLGPLAASPAAALLAGDGPAKRPAPGPGVGLGVGLGVGDPVSFDAIIAARDALGARLGEVGYPFARIEEPTLRVDHETHSATIIMPADPGGRYEVGQVVSSAPDFLSSRHLARIARFDAGDGYRHSEVDDLRRAIMATGLVGSARVVPVEVVAPRGQQPGIVDLRADLAPAPLRTITGGLGYGTQEGVRLAGSWEHRNLFPSEGMLRLRGEIGTLQQLAGITLRKNNFGGRDRILTLDAFVSTIGFPAYEARTISTVGTFEKVSNLLFQKAFSWSVGVELVATQERQRTRIADIPPRETFLIIALPLFAQLDTSNNLLNPTSGWRLSGRLSPEASSSEGVQSFYVRGQVDASYYREMGDRLVVAGRLRVASIPGADIAAIAPSRRLYAGGGGSVRGYGFRMIGPTDAAGDLTGGRSLGEFSLEARVRTGLLGGTISVVPFFDGGTVGRQITPDFETMRFGAGIGLRYDSGFGPVRVDVATPINPGPMDDAIFVYLALGQAF